MSVARRLAMAALLSTGLGGCEAYTFVETDLVVPSGMAAPPSPALVHVQRRATTAAACPGYDPGAPSDFDAHLRIARGRVWVGQGQIPSVGPFCMAAWYDANGDGILDSGDAIGKLEAAYAGPRSRLFSANHFTSPPIRLRRVP